MPPPAGCDVRPSVCLSVNNKRKEQYALHKHFVESGDSENGM